MSEIKFPRNKKCTSGSCREPFHVNRDVFSERRSSALSLVTIDSGLEGSEWSLQRLEAGYNLSSVLLQRKFHSVDSVKDLQTSAALNISCIKKIKKSHSKFS